MNLKDRTDAQLKKIAFGTDSDLIRKKAMDILIKRILQKAYDNGHEAGEKAGYERAKQEAWDLERLKSPLICTTKRKY